MITVINRLTVHGDVAVFEKVLEGITDHMSSQPGFLSHCLYRSLRKPNVFVETARWTDAASHRAAMKADAFQERVKGLGDLATPEPDIFEIVDED
ncbi:MULTISPECIES: antibiotic biosynthesis monooxygenase family protein [unclassified Streptomyces]|uniref:antibiotic biosynthesis monooxygenase family protein n=1 Tax=unclassified Streptomyces TaxID=2593676 RepID=UPI0024A912F0|nr:MULTISPECIES: antibiotic biosynthesis monooxygenase family protein [unclassified Streptomyces]